LGCAFLGALPLARSDEQQSPTPAATTVSAVSQRQSIAENFRHDAALADVYFCDRATGWAVGDRGVIWHTDDGGSTWRQQSSGTTCPLHAVQFLDPRRGWAVGGERRPYTDSTRGVVLRTDDGGTTWSAVPGLVLPRLSRLRFFDEQRGVALGEATSTVPSGVFVTQDGGDSWHPLPANRAGGWYAGDFLDAENGAVAGPGGAFATLARRRIVHSPLAMPSLRSFRAMRLVAPSGGWLVGDGGVVLTSKDLGHSWQSPPADLSELAGEHFDFCALAVIDARVWIAGSPGTRVFHSSDGGRSWQSFATGQSAPLRGLTFVDSAQGWAVGDLGNILITRDGGRSWHLQRPSGYRGGRRAALLGVFAGANDVPLELLAEAGAAQGYITAIDILHTSADPEPAAPPAIPRVRDAMLLCGAATADVAWRFPLPPAKLALAPAELLETLNRANDGRAIQQLQAYLVRELRTWRPDVVVTQHRRMEITQPMAALTEQLVVQAVRSAADPAQYVELDSQAGLAPWQVKKVYGVLPPGARGDEVLETGRFSPWLGTTPADYVAPARERRASATQAGAVTVEFELLLNHVDAANPSRGLFGGIQLPPGCDARRPALDRMIEDSSELRRVAARRRHLQALLERQEGDMAWAAQVANLTEDLDADSGARLLAQLADGYRETGRLDLAADTYFLLARRHPDHPLVDGALVWLLRFYASSEAAHRSAARGLADMRDGEAASNIDSSVRQTSLTESDSRALATAPAVGLSRDDRLRRAVQMAEYLQNARPATYAEPSVRFAEISARRQLGFTNPAKRYFLTLRQRPDNDPWRQCAATEQWLATPGDLPPPKALGACRPIKERPHLDGLLDEPFWDAADRLRLRADDVGRTILSVDQSNPTRTTDGEVRLAYDREFLYLAIRCPNAEGGDHRLDDRPRPRDADLEQHDRVSLRLDVDRDFTTAFELTIDSRGWTHDACWGDANWNPNWYVAASRDESTWTIEAAVPLAELVAEPPAARDVWALAVRRVIPRVGYETWAGHVSSDKSPDEFGLVIFE
jgi:photosystem II stability/assembly factor-like uncharacterized protein